MRTPTFEEKSQNPNLFSSFFAVFVGNSVTPISTLANNKRSCSKKGTFQAKIGFFYFSGENFVTPFSTFANNKRSYPTNSTTPD